MKGLNAAGFDLELVSKFLDTSGGKVDYKRYWETLFDILFAGGILGRWKLILKSFPSAASKDAGSAAGLVCLAT